MASSQDAWYLSLLGLAEHFRSPSPPNIKACIQCLQAVFNFKPPPRVEARTHLQLGNILLVHTRNVDLARTHLEKAWELSQAIQSFDDVKFESASVLAQLFEQQQQQKWAKEWLRRAVEMSQGSCYWHCRLLFQLAQLHATEKDYVSACSLLGVGVEFTRISGANYTQILFLLSKTMLLLAERKLSEASPLLVQGGSLVEAWQGTVQQKEYLKVFFLVLQTCYYLLAGQVKCSKSWLKQLQQSVQEISQWPDEDQVPACSGAGDMFMWMPKEELCVVVYLVTVMHSMQAGYMDKAQKYSEKALSQIERLSVSEERPILRTFQLMILEHVVQCRLVMGDNTNAIQEVSNICALCSRRPTLLSGHRAQVHTILGLYAMSMGCMDAAEAQLNAALRTSQERELWTFVNMNLAIVYLRTGRQSDFLALLDRVSPEALPSQSHCLRAASYYIQGLHGFFQHHYNDAKRYLRETLKMANSEDLNRLTSCSLVLLGNIFLSLGNNRDSFNMVTPAMQLASKIPDVNVQMWASAVLKDLYRACGDHGKESAELQKRTGFAQALLLDRNTALQSPHHGLLRWTDGPVPSSAAASSSSTETSHPQAAAACSSVAPAAAAASVQSSPAPLSRTTPLPVTVSPAAATAAVGVPNQQPCQQRAQIAQRQQSPHPAAAHISSSAHASAAHISPKAHAAAHISPSAHAAAHISPSVQAAAHISPSAHAAGTTAHVSPSAHASAHVSPSAHAAAHVSPSAHAAAHMSPSAHTVSARLALQQQDQAAQLAAAAAGYHQAAGGGGGYSASGVMTQQEAMVGYGGMMTAAQTHAHQPVARQVAAMSGGVMQAPSQQGFHHSHHMMTPQQAHQLAGMYAPSMMAAAAAAAAAHQSSYHHQPPP